MLSVTFSNRNRAALTARWRQRAAELSNAVIKAENQSAFAMKQQAIRLSHGPMKTADLAKLAREVNRGYGLYGTRSPMPPMDPAVVNLQSGRLSRSWQTRLVLKPDGTSVTLWNTTPYAKYLLGTRKMIPRPILQKVIELERAARLHRLAKANSRALKL